MQLMRDAFPQRKWSTAALVLRNGLNAHAEPISPDAEWRVILGTCSKLLFPKNLHVLADFFDFSFPLHWLRSSFPPLNESLDPLLSGDWLMPAPHVPHLAANSEP